MNSRMLLVAFILALAVSPQCGANSNFSQAVPVDTSWRAIAPVGDLTGQGINNVGLGWEAANLGWNTDVNFDDSGPTGWTDTLEVAHPNPPFIRYWVDGTETVGSSPAYFRKEFSIPGSVISALLDFGVDDDAQVYINGQLVFDDANSLATTKNNINVLPHIHGGLNLIAVKAQDQQGAQSIFGQLNLISEIPEPSSLGLIAVGLLALLPRVLKIRSPQ